VLDGTGDVISRKIGVLLGKATLDRIDLCPLFLRHPNYLTVRALALTPT
jgi:hypothetical protein